MREREKDRRKPQVLLWHHIHHTLQSHLAFEPGKRRCHSNAFSPKNSLVLNFTDQAIIAITRCYSCSPTTKITLNGVMTPQLNRKWCILKRMQWYISLASEEIFEPLTWCLHMQIVALSSNYMQKTAQFRPLDLPANGLPGSGMERTVVTEAGMAGVVCNKPVSPPTCWTWLCREKDTYIL